MPYLFVCDNCAAVSDQLANPEHQDGVYGTMRFQRTNEARKLYSELCQKCYDAAHEAARAALKRAREG